MALSVQSLAQQGSAFSQSLSASGINRIICDCNLCLEIFVNSSVSVGELHRKLAAAVEVDGALSNFDVQIYSRLLASFLI